MNLKLISIIVPVYNEEKNISIISKELIKVLEALKPNYEFEIILVNDGSQDRSGEIIKNLASFNQEIKYIEFSRNFGKEIALTAGLHHCAGDVAIMIDADLQQPPELIPEFIKKWENGAEIVVGVRGENKERIIKRAGSFLFYKIISLIGETKIIPRATDYRLIDKKVIREFNRFTERNRMTRGLLDWMGFKRDFIYFKANQRRNGEVKYNYLKLVRLAFSAFVSYSLFPLRLASYLGVIISFFSGCLGLFMIVEKYILKDPLSLHFSGPAMLAVMILFLVGVILTCLGLMALYIANIHEEVINRPMYVIKEKKLQ